MDVLHTAPKDAISSHAFSIAIKSTNDWKVAIKILQRAREIHKADQEVFMATAHVCIVGGEYRRAFALIDAVLIGDEIAHINKFTLSTAISICLDIMHGNEGNSGNCNGDGDVNVGRRLERYLRANEDLITNGVCQRVISGLIAAGDWKRACVLHTSVFRGNTIKTDTLTDLLRLMQTIAERRTSTVNTLADYAMQIINLYTTHPEGEVFRKHLTRTTHFNSVIRILFVAGQLGKARQIFERMVCSDDSPNNKAWSWRPNTFTIAELVRCGKEMSESSFIADVIQWGCDRDTYIPPGVVSDAISSAYDRGDLESARQIYDTLYQAGKVNHYFDGQDGILDLHDFSRAMAFCAISSTLDQLRENSEIKELIIITGKSSHQCIDSSIDLRMSGTDDHCNIVEQGKISLFLQDMLVNVFFPPLSSSTVPGNPGRLYISEQEVKKHISSQL